MDQQLRPSPGLRGHQGCVPAEGQQIVGARGHQAGAAVTQADGIQLGLRPALQLRPQTGDDALHGVRDHLHLLRRHITPVQTGTHQELQLFLQRRHITGRHRLPGYRRARRRVELRSESG